MSEAVSSAPVNNISSGSIDTFSPVMGLTKRKPIPLRKIIGPASISRELSKDKSHGI